MCRFIETICVKDGKILHLADHQERMDETICHFFGASHAIKLQSLLTVPSGLTQGLVKCRIVYSQHIEDISWAPYQVRQIKTLALVHADDVDYSWKYFDRSVFSELIRKAHSDDIILVKDGYITDSSYANILFRMGKEWFTPSTPLLNGTQRKRLLETGAIGVDIIREQDLGRFDRIKWINAMMDMDTGPDWPIEVIRNAVKKTNKKAGC